MDVPTCRERLKFIECGNLNEESLLIDDSSMSEWTISLKQHQKAAIHAMRNAESSHQHVTNATFKTTMGIIADCPGSGKTFDILGTIALCPIIKKFPKTIHQYGLKTIQVESTLIMNTFKESNLIIVPHALVTQWKRAIEKTTIQYNIVRTRRHIDEFKIDETTTITLISSSMYVEFINRFKNFIWSRIVFDEADTINIPRCPIVESNFTWFVTSSLENVLFPSGSYFVRLKLPHNRIITHRKMIEGVKRTGYISDVLKSLELAEVNQFLPLFVFKNNDSFVNNILNIGDPTINKVICHEPLYLDLLCKFVAKDILEHLNAGNINAAIEKLGANVDSKENIVSTFTRSLEIKINNSKRHKIYIESLECSNEHEEESKRKRILFLENDIVDKESKLSNIRSRCNSVCMCPICLDEPETPTLVGCCKSTFCMKCITNSLIKTNQSCPLCRQKLENKDIFIVGENAKKSRSLPSKIEALETIIRLRRGKFLVFSTNHNIFRDISVLLHKHHIRSEYIIGSGSRIDNIIDEYKTGALNVLLLNAQYYGTGVDLENTTDLIFMHKMSKDMERQVIGRAQRQGRTSRLTIHYLFHNNEMNGN